MRGLFSKLRVRVGGWFVSLCIPAFIGYAYSQQTTQNDLEKELAEIEAEERDADEALRKAQKRKNEIAARKKALLAQLNREKAVQSNPGHLKANAALGITHMGDKGSTAGVGNFNFSYTRGQNTFKLADFLDIKGKGNSTAWRHQLSMSLDRRVNDRLGGFGEFETIYNNGVNKQNLFGGISAEILRGELYFVRVEVGAGAQYREKLHLAATQRTQAGCDLWGFANVKADVKWIFTGDEKYRFDLDEKRIRLDFSVGKPLFGVNLEGFYRRLDDKRGEDYNTAGLRVRYALNR